MRSKQNRLNPTNLNNTSPWFIDILVPDPLKLRDYLKDQGVGSRPFYPPIHSQPAYSLPGDYSKTEYVSAREKVEIHSNGRVIGTIISPKLIINEGAYLEANCQTTEKVPQATTEPALPQNKKTEPGINS